MDSARIVGALARYTGDFSLAEDLAQEALAEALVPGPSMECLPSRPDGCSPSAAAQVPFAVPEPHELAERLGSVLQVVYLIFMEGSFASGGDEWIRTDLATEARRLARMLAQLAPEPEVFGLLALLELTAARFPARLDTSGRPVLLEDQDRRLWDQSTIRHGRPALARAVAAGRGLGAFGLQASIAECHAVAHSVAETDWQRIVILYEALERLTPSSIIELNRAIAVAMASGPADGLVLVDAIASRTELTSSHLLPAIRGEMLARLGRHDEARSALLQAVELCGNAAERAVLQRKLDEVSDRRDA